MREYTNVIAAAAMVAFVAIFYDYVVNHRLAFLGFSTEAPAESKPLPVLDITLAVGSMLVGILFGAARTILMEKDTRSSFSAAHVIKKTIQSAGLWRSLLAAPIVFIGVYLAAQAQPDRIVALLFAFQNGFFCESVLENAQS